MGTPEARNLHVIIGERSQSGKMQLSQIRGKEESAVGTGTTISHLYTPDGGVIEVGGLIFRTVETVQNGVDAIIAGIEANLAGGYDNMVITFHAMTLGQMDGTPGILVENVRDKIAHLNIKGVQIRFISFNKGSHVWYAARGKKETLEASLPSDGHIADLTIFDSPSAKAIGLTHLGVVADFVRFLETVEGQKRMSGIVPLLKNIIGSKSYGVLLEFLAEYPLDGELKDGQRSMKELTSQERSIVLGNIMRRLEPARLSLISGTISEIYLEFVGRELAKEDSYITTGRTFLSWENVTSGRKRIDLWKIYVKLSGYLTKGDTRKDRLFIEEPQGTESEIRLYTINRNALHFIDQHFGVVPLMMCDQLIRQSGLLSEGEYVDTLGAKQSIYSYNKIAIRRSGDDIVLYNTENPREVFIETKVKRSGIYDTKQASGENPIFELNQLEMPPMLELPHGYDWQTQFSAGIPKEILGIKIDAESALLEHVGFIFARLVQTTKTGVNTGLNISLVKEIEGKFARISRSIPMTGESLIALQNGDIHYQVERFRGRNGVYVLTLNLIKEGSIVGRFDASIV